MTMKGSDLNNMRRVTAKGTLRPFLQVTGLVLMHSVISVQQSFQVKRFMI